MTTQNMILSAYSATPTASTIAQWDANKNLSANSYIEAYTTTATAAATTTLVVGSTYQQYFTGSTTQTVKLPVTSTLVNGQSFYIVNNSSGVVTVQSSGANTIQAMAANTTLLVTCINTGVTTAAGWNAQYLGAASGGGTVNSGTAGQLAYYSSTGAAVSGGQVGNILGTATNDNASTGYVGEFVSNDNSGGTSLSSGVNANICSISLTAGDWDVWGNYFTTSSVPGINSVDVGISTVSVTFPGGEFIAGIYFPAGGFQNYGTPAVQQRISIGTTTTVYLVGQTTGSGTLTGYGYMAARRPR